MSLPDDVSSSPCNINDGCYQCTNCAHAICLNEQRVHIIQHQTFESYLCNCCYDSISERFIPAYDYTPHNSPNRSRSSSFDNDIIQPLIQEQNQEHLLFNIILELQKQWTYESHDPDTNQQSEIFNLLLQIQKACANDPYRLFNISSQLLTLFQDYHNVIPIQPLHQYTPPIIVK